MFLTRLIVVWFLCAQIINRVRSRPTGVWGRVDIIVHSANTTMTTTTAAAAGKPTAVMTRFKWARELVIILLLSTRTQTCYSCAWRAGGCPSAVRSCSTRTSFPTHGSHEVARKHPTLEPLPLISCCDVSSFLLPRFHNDQCLTL